MRVCMSACLRRMQDGLLFNLCCHVRIEVRGPGRAKVCLIRASDQIGDAAGTGQHSQVKIVDSELVSRRFKYIQTVMEESTTD